MVPHTQLPHIAGASGKEFEIEHGSIIWGYAGNSFRKSSGFLRVDLVIRLPEGGFRHSKDG